jgi:hypothetical protein
VLADLFGAESHEMRRKLIDDVTPGDPGNAFGQLGDDELTGNEEMPPVAKARRHLVLWREESAGW